MNTPIRDCPQPDYQIRERAYTPAQTQAREYAAIQALADRRTVGQRRADVEAWRKPAPQRRRIDAQPQDTGLIGQCHSRRTRRTRLRGPVGFVHRDHDADAHGDGTRACRSDPGAVMSGPVDVLAEMQADIDALEKRVLAGEFTLSRGYDKVNRLREIRAVVAELIEAVEAETDALTNWHGADGTRMAALKASEGRVMDALARCKGSAS